MKHCAGEDASSAVVAKQLVDALAFGSGVAETLTSETKRAIPLDDVFVNYVLSGCP